MAASGSGSGSEEELGSERSDLREDWSSSSDSEEEQFDSSKTKATGDERRIVKGSVNTSDESDSDAGVSSSNSNEEEEDDDEEDVKDLTMEERMQRQSAGQQEAALLGTRTRLKRSERGYVVAKRENKNRPTELSSKKPVSRLRQVVSVPKVVRRDPRFDSLSGKFNEDLFQKAYSFLDEYRDNEIEEIKRELKKQKNSEKAKELQGLLTSLQQKRTSDKKKRELKSALQKRKREEREAVKAGKTPFYLAERGRKKLELEQRFKELEGSGQLEKYIQKKRRKNANKDHRWLPTNRR